MRELLAKLDEEYLLNHKEIKQDIRSKETTPVHGIFGGYLRTERNKWFELWLVFSQHCNTNYYLQVQAYPFFFFFAVKCTECETIFMSFQSFCDISIDIESSNTLNEALACVFQEEETNGYKCKVCRKFVKASKQILIEKPPVVLCIHLKR